MRMDNLNKWLTLLANLSVVAGIIFLGIEIRQNSESKRMQAAQSFLFISYELDLRLVDDPSLIALILSSPEDRTPAESLRMERWLFAVFRIWQNAYYLHTRGILEDELWAGQKLFMSDTLGRYEELQTCYQSNRKYFSEGFIDFLDGLLEKKAA